jgi:transposase
MLSQRRGRGPCLEVGYEVHLANTAAIKKCDGLKHSGDEADTFHLAHLLRLGILPVGHICPPKERMVRDLSRKRLQLSRCRTRQILSIENLLARQTGTAMTSNQIKQLQEKGVDLLGLPEDVALALKADLAVMTTLEAQIDKLEQRLREKTHLRPGYRLLKTAPGIGEVLAATIMLERERWIDSPRSAISVPTAAA